MSPAEDAIDIAAIATNLIKSESGIWVARHQREVSYPSDGNDSCLSVEDSSFWFRHRNDVITSLVKEFSPRKTFFDIGGGNGYVAVALQCLGIDTILVEPGPQGARNARRRGVNVVIQSSLEDAGFKASSIDACGLFDVLEHIKNDIDFLSMVHDYMRPGGVLYITVPAYNALWSVDDDEAGHYRRYTMSSLADCLASVGFSVAYCSYFFSTLVPAVLLFRSIPSLLRIRSRSIEVVKQEHSGRNPFAGFLLARSLDIELKRIKQQKRMLTGSSCVAVVIKAA